MRLKEVRLGDKLAKHLTALDPLTTIFHYRDIRKSLQRFLLRNFSNNLQTLNLSGLGSQASACSFGCGPVSVLTPQPSSPSPPLLLCPLLLSASEQRGSGDPVDCITLAAQ